MDYFWMFILKYAFVVAALSTAIAFAKPLAPIRSRINKLDDRWLGPLVCCPWCMNYWVAGVLVLWPLDIVGGMWYEYIVAWCVLSAASTIVCLPIVVLIKILDGQLGTPIYVLGSALENNVCPDENLADYIEDRRGK